MPANQSMLAQLIGAASSAASDKYKSDSESSLKRYLTAKEPELAGQKQQAQNKANLATLTSPEFQEQLNQGGSVKAGDLSVGADPMARAYMMSDKGEEAARQKAIANYNHALPKLQSTFQAAQEGLTAVNDPKNPGSMGQARTLALKALGMNRYNEKEAEAVVPPALRGTFSQLFNQAGGDMNPLNESQRAALNQFFQTQLHTVKQQHDMLKQGSLDTYDSSRYAAPTGHQTLQNRLGGGFSQALDQADKQFQNTPATQGPTLDATPLPGPIDRLKAFLTGAKAPAPAAAPAPAQPQSFNPDSFLKGQ